MRLLQRIITTYRCIRYIPEELIWAQTWNDTKKDIEWIQKLPGISPGRWAVGYNYLYVMTRVLNEIEPHSVLDLGLGISSTLISCYFDYYRFEDGIHTVVESNNDWIQFYLRKRHLAQATEIIHCDYENNSHCGKTYRAFADFRQKLDGRKFGVISIDAPLGSPRYSRRDIVQLIPDILEDSFVIIMDDSNRKGEQDTIREIEEALCKNGIPFYTGHYRGYTDCCVIVSQNNKYICSM